MFTKLFKEKKITDKKKNIGRIETMRRSQIGDTVREAPDGSWRYVMARVMGGVEKLYLQVRNKKKEWGRLVRAETTKTRGFSKTFKKYLDNGIPAPVGYKLSKTSFINEKPVIKLIKQKPPREPTFRQLLHPNIDIETPRKRNTVRQFDIEFYVKPTTFRSDPMAEYFYVGSDRYEKWLLRGQDLVVIADTDKLKRSVSKKWSSGWNTTKDYKNETGLGLLQLFYKSLKEMPNEEAREAGQEIENKLSFFEKNPTIIKFKNFATEINLDQNNRQPIDYVSLLVREDSVELPPMLDSRYTDYYCVGDEVEEGIVYRNLKNIYKPNLCMLSVILEAFLKPEVKERLEKKRMKQFLSVLSYEGLVNFLFKDMSVQDIQERGVSVQDVQPFFEKWGLSLFVYDVYGQLRHTFVPENKNSTIRPRRISIMLHERHAYLLNKGLDHLEQVESPILKRDKKDIRKKVKFYKSKKDTDEKHVMVAWTIPEAVQLMNEINKQAREQKAKNKQKKINNEEEDEIPVIKVYTKDAFLPSLVMHLRDQYNIRASILLKNTTQISSVRFQHCQFVSMASSTCGDLVYKTKPALVHLIKCQEKLYKGCFSNPAWRSVYNVNTYRLLTTNKPSPLVNNYIKTNKKGYTKYDIKKCYTSHVRDAQWILRLNGFDKLEVYDGQGVEDTCLYYVKKKSENLSRFPLKRLSLVYGKHLNSRVADDVDILGVLRPSHKVSNLIADKYKQVFEDQKLIQWEKEGVLENARKWLLNTTTGTSGQHIRSHWSGRVFSDIDEARDHVDKEGGGVRYFRIKNDDGSTSNVPDLFLQYSKVWHELTDGFLLFHHYIVESCIVQMLDLKRDLENVGYTVYDIKTDCCDVDYNPTSEKKFKEQFGSKWFRTGTEWEQIGGVNVEHFPDQRPIHTHKQIGIEHEDLVEAFSVKPKLPKTEDQIEKERELDDDNMIGEIGFDEDGFQTVIYPKKELDLFEKTKVEEIKVDDEWNINYNVLGKRCCIEAVIPGSGKTYISQKLLGKVLFVCPNNKIVTNLLKKDCDAVTLDHLFGYYLQRNAETFELDDKGLREKFNVKDQEQLLSNYDYITFEEVLLNSIDKIYSIKKFVDTNGDRFKGIYLNYDENQNRSPDERLSNIPTKDVKKYKLKICREITGRYLVLQEMKRNTNPENVKHYKHLLKLTKKNDVKAINQYLLNNCKVVKRIEDINTNVCIAYTNYQCDQVNQHTYRRLYGNSPLQKGMVMIYKGKSQIVGTCKTRFFKNDEYEIVDIVKKNNENIYTLNHYVSGKTDVSESQLMKLWKLPFCWTGHSTQGSTIDTPYTIDLNCCFNNAEWLWTAVTRCTDWSLITVFYNPILRQNFINKLRNDANRKIQGYAQQDLKANRFIKNPNDYIDVDWITEHLHEGSCVYCGEPYEFGNSNQFTIDRICNQTPHTKNNCQVVCLRCNTIKR